MNKNIITFGGIAGIIVSTVMLIAASRCYTDANYEGSEVLGYSSMVVAFAIIFIAVKSYRDKANEGYISFGKAFLLGISITAVASTLYVIAWLIYYYNFIPDFMDKYAQHMLNKAKADGVSAAEYQKTMLQMEDYKSMYKNPAMVVLLTYLEIAPIGLIFSVLAALIFKKKTKPVF